MDESRRKVLNQMFLDSLTVERLEVLYKIAVKRYAKEPSFREKTHRMVKVLQGVA